MQNIVMEIWYAISNSLVALQKAPKCCEHYGGLRRLFGPTDDDLAWSQMDPEFQTKLKMLPRWVFQQVTLVP